MYDSFNPVRPLPLTVATSFLVIEGTLQTRLQRLTDVLNDPNTEHLILLDATFMEVESRRVVAGPSLAQVQLDDVLFIHTTGNTESGGERVPKKPLRASVLVGPFTIEGEVHLAFEAELNAALDGVTGRFLPITNARYWASAAAEAPNLADLIAVNHARAHISLAPDAEWNPEAQLSDAADASNPW